VIAFPCFVCFVKDVIWGSDVCGAFVSPLSIGPVRIKLCDGDNCVAPNEAAKEAAEFAVRADSNGD
jgi:hypothetical protein